ncbi:uncharacterized protein SAPINGB_P000137 [Magnusiomyces paraingens]|uniref:MARVEL domain-containing protein n=1 Tax=Magnusiomyces paraingens TaxID=2606893 RepID=A0A5E8B4F9_9ASCO|nr:uncharacterized protein SAPINGB_P000137 [Saprochaete ingens]VVT43770.1 unnamed protein product [Saprochaete ingens]
MTKTTFSIQAITTPLFIIRIVQLVMSIIILGIAAASVHKTNEAFDRAKMYVESMYRYSNVSIEKNHSCVFSTFVSVWTILANLYLMVSPFVLEIAAFPPLFLVVEFLSNIFWFVSWIYLATYAGDIGSCRYEICKLVQADTVLSALTWPSFIASLFLVLKSAIPYIKAKGWTTKLAGLPGGYFPVIEGSIENAAAANISKDEVQVAEAFLPDQTMGRAVLPPEKNNDTLVPAGMDLEANRR